MVKSTKKQATLALIAVVLATAMIVGTFATSADNSAFAKKKIRQSISQDANNAQTANCITPGGTGGVTGGIGGAIAAGACVNSATSNPVNTGSNTFSFLP